MRQQGAIALTLDDMHGTRAASKAYGEVRVAAREGMVVVDEVVLGQVIAQGNEDLALSWHHLSLVLGEGLRDHERHGSIVDDRVMRTGMV